MFKGTWFTQANGRTNRKEKQFIELNETLNDFIIGSNTNVFVIRDEAMEPQADGYYINPEKIVAAEISNCQNQVEGNNFDAKFRKTFLNAVNTVKNRMRDLFLTAMDNVIIPRVELAVRSYKGSSRRGINSAVQNPDRGNSIGNTENTTLK